MDVNQTEKEQEQMAEAELKELNQSAGDHGEEIPEDLGADAEIDELDLLNNELSEAQSKADEYMDGWQRSRAEFANYKKRVERERRQMYQNASAGIIKNYLDIMDDLKRALENRPHDGDGAAWSEGIELIYRKLQATLENEGVQPMNASGQVFDPNLHEAISLEENLNHESGEIIEVIKEGYMMEERVIRPASVRVAK